MGAPIQMSFLRAGLAYFSKTTLYYPTPSITNYNFAMEDCSSVYGLLLMVHSCKHPLFFLEMLLSN